MNKTEFNTAAILGLVEGIQAAFIQHMANEVSIGALKSMAAALNYEIDSFAKMASQKGFENDSDNLLKLSETLVQQLDLDTIDFNAEKKIQTALVSISEKIKTTKKKMSPAEIAPPDAAQHITNGIEVLRKQVSENVPVTQAYTDALAKFKEAIDWFLITEEQLRPTLDTLRGTEKEKIGTINNLKLRFKAIQESYEKWDTVKLNSQLKYFNEEINKKIADSINTINSLVSPAPVPQEVPVPAVSTVSSAVNRAENNPEIETKVISEKTGEKENVVPEISSDSNASTFNQKPFAVSVITKQEPEPDFENLNMSELTSEVVEQPRENPIEQHGNKVDETETHDAKIVKATTSSAHEPENTIDIKKKQQENLRTEAEETSKNPSATVFPMSNPTETSSENTRANHEFDLSVFNSITRQIKDINARYVDDDQRSETDDDNANDDTSALASDVATRLYPPNDTDSGNPHPSGSDYDSDTSNNIEVPATGNTENSKKKDSGTIPDSNRVEMNDPPSNEFYSNFQKLRAEQEVLKQERHNEPSSTSDITTVVDEEHEEVLDKLAEKNEHQVAPVSPPANQPFRVPAAAIAAIVTGLIITVTLILLVVFMPELLPKLITAIPQIPQPVAEVLVYIGEAVTILIPMAIAAALANWAEKKHVNNVAPDDTAQSDDKTENLSLLKESKSEYSSEVTSKCEDSVIGDGYSAPCTKSLISTTMQTVQQTGPDANTASTSPSTTNDLHQTTGETPKPGTP